MWMLSHLGSCCGWSCDGLCQLGCHGLVPTSWSIELIGKTELYWTRDPLSCLCGFVPNVVLSLLLQVPTEASA